MLCLLQFLLFVLVLKMVEKFLFLLVLFLLLLVVELFFVLLFVMRLDLQPLVQVLINFVVLL